MDVFNALARELPLEYKVLLVGTNDDIDKALDDSIVSIHRTSSKEELAQYYSAADVFVNPTREEVLGMVNIEALACGLPVITFDTGGCRECIDENSGVAVSCDDTDALIVAIKRVCSEGANWKESCVAQAIKFNEQDKYLEYIGVYNE